MREFGMALGIALVLLILVYIPVGLIWALNALFPSLAIPFTFKTWLAAMIVIVVFGPVTVSSKK